MESYEEKYKNVMEILKKAASDPNCEDERFCCVVYDLFPELKESEDVDKKIREDIIATIHLYYGKPLEDEAKEMIAWLEKQGEQPKEATYTREVETGNGNIKALVTEKVQLPKFHEGEWITNGNYTWKIVEVKSLDYILQSQDGNIVDDTISHVDEQFHSFTIDDAKDGEVLVVPPIKGSEHSEQIFIFKEIKDREYVKNAVEFYCRCMDNEFASNERGFMGQSDDYFTPATKEQRDTLEKAMADAGYTFDFEKKELKKIGQNIEMVEALRTEYEKGRADVLRCIDPDVMVADFCSQPLSKTRSLVSIYRQGIIDIIKRINNNEETSITGTRSINDCGM